MTVKRSMEALGFQEQAITLRQRMIVSVEGLEKQGKSHFALTAPGPIAVFDFDVGLEGVVHKFDNKEVYVSDYRRFGQMDTAQFIPTWERFRKEYLGVLHTPGIRTIIWDTATEVWASLRLARFGKLTQVMPHQYGPVNAEYEALLKMAYGDDKNLILLHKMRDVYKNEKRTGDIERSGYSGTGYAVQTNVRMKRDEDGTWILVVRDCRQNPELDGTELMDDMCGFPHLASMVFETGLEEWE